MNDSQYNYNPMVGAAALENRLREIDENVLKDFERLDRDLTSDDLFQELKKNNAQREELNMRGAILQAILYKRLEQDYKSILRNIVRLY